MVSILALNLASPTKERARALLEWLWLQPEDLWVLTDLGRGPGARLMAEVVAAAGFDRAATEQVLVVARDVGLTPVESTSPRTCGVVVEGLRLLGVYGAASDPVRYSSSSQRQRKREWLVEFEQLLSAYDVVVGDLNIAPDRSLPYVLEEEVALYQHQPLRDAWGDRPEEPSWVDHTGAGVRYDQAWVGDAVEVVDCHLDQHPRLHGLTDHAALRLALRRIG